MTEHLCVGGPLHGEVHELGPLGAAVAVETREGWALAPLELDMVGLPGMPAAFAACPDGWAGVAVVPYLRWQRYHPGKGRGPVYVATPLGRPADKAMLEAALTLLHPRWREGIPAHLGGAGHRIGGSDRVSRETGPGAESPGSV